MTVPTGTQQGWNIHINQPTVIHIPRVRETDARAMVAAYLAGQRTAGPDWVITTGTPTITGTVLWLSPNEVPAWTR